MYAAHDIRRPICDSEFFPPSHLCLVVYMCPTPICNIRRPMCDSDFFGPRSQVTLDECRQNNGKVETKFAVANRPSDVVSRIHVYVDLHFPRYSPDNILQVKVTTARSNQGQTMTLHTYTP